MQNKKLELLKSITLGKRIAEEERDTIKQYFFKSNQWNRIFNGEIDIIYGQKGSGKSAIYLSLIDNEDLPNNDINVIAAENLSGATAFKNLITDPPPTENSFIFLWKVYIIYLLIDIFKGKGISGLKIGWLKRKLIALNVYPKQASVLELLKGARNLLNAFVNPTKAALSFTTEVNSLSQTTSFSTKYDFESGNIDRNISVVSLDSLISYLSNVLERNHKIFWIVFDRLDVAFAESRQLEANALRALFRVYNDIKNNTNLKTKIFVRDDIWERITEKGFTEASHIVNTTTISWDQDSIINMLFLRIFNEGKMKTEYKINDIEEVPFADRKEKLYSLFTEKVDEGKNPKTIEWIIKRTMDSSDRISPREIIHLIDEAKNYQIKLIERNDEKDIDGDILFSKKAIKEGFVVASKEKYQKVMLAEYPEFRAYFEAFRKHSSEYKIEDLAKLWKVRQEEAKKIVLELQRIHFIKQKNDKDQITYWIPFIFRPALDIVKGSE